MLNPFNKVARFIVYYEKAMKKWILMSIFLVSIAPAFAASDLSLFAGWTYVGSVKSATEVVDLKNFGVFGLRYEKYVAIFGLESTLTYHSSPIVATGEEGNAGLSYLGNFVINLPAGKSVPFFVVGLGVLHRFGGSFPDVGTRFVTNYGAGIKIRKILKSVGFRLDYRRLTVHEILGESAKTNELSGGVVFSF